MDGTPGPLEQMELELAFRAGRGVPWSRFECATFPVICTRIDGWGTVL